MSPKLKKISYEFYSDLGGCQNIIFVYTQKNQKYRDNAIASIGCACQNISLSAVNKKLGTCWIGSFKGFEKEINKLLKVPKDHELIASMLIGPPAKNFKPLKRTKKKIPEILSFT